ncbi:hypothetical protein JHK85_001596 [Glycine max]|nr:hypothetical protein JHK85_001596 [Glycine max]
MEDPPLQKIAISGPTLASLIQRFSTSPSSIHGLLFGHVTPLPLTLSDDDTSSAATPTPTLLATVTGFLTSPSFHDSSGTVLPSSLPNSPLLGWFSARRRSPLRPSMREFSVTASLSSLTQFSSQIQNPNSEPSLFPPCIFLLLASPSSDNHHSHVHTHEYRAFQFRPAALSFEPRSLDVVNIGPAFRGHYGAFSPNSNLPPLDCGPHGSPMMMSDGGDEVLGKMKQAAKDQRELDKCAEGFEIGRLSRMMGSEARSCTEGLEELYQKMLVKIENLTGLVEKSSAMVLEQDFRGLTFIIYFASEVIPKDHELCPPVQIDNNSVSVFGMGVQFWSA